MPAGASQLEVNLPGDIPNQYISTKSLNASEQTWVNTTFTAPQTGSYTIYITPDFHDDVRRRAGKSKDV